MTEQQKQLAAFISIQLRAVREAIKVSKLKAFNGLDAELKDMIDRLKDGDPGNVC